MVECAALFHDQDPACKGFFTRIFAQLSHSDRPVTHENLTRRQGSYRNIEVRPLQDYASWRAL